ncbi:FAD-binding dehydrogenase [Nakamurella sp.]|uniref:FAD-binding dehydrogenase n=1 Tax=Nakamurella sp. TaxID=1869182 RepID=UPI003783B0CE
MADADIIVVGAGLAGLVAAIGAADAGRSVLVLDQEGPESLGGQAWWSLGGLFLVNSPEQRRLRIRDSVDLAYEDWMGSAGFDRPEDHWPREWAKAYLDFAAGEKRAWLKDMGIGLFPVVQWAERGGYEVGAHGNSVPRFHVTWGSGPGVVDPFIRRISELERAGRVTVRFRHRVTALTVDGGRVTGAAGEVLEPTTGERGEPSSRSVVGDFSLTGSAVIVASGGMGANHELVRRYWPGGPGAAPAELLSGVPDGTDGLMLGVAERAGGRTINLDRMWHYPEGVRNHSPVWTGHGIRILSGPSPLWLDAFGRRLPAPLFPGFDSLGALRHILTTGRSHSWFLLDRQTVGPEFGLSGSEQNPDFAAKSVKLVLTTRAGGKITPPVQAFLDKGVDFLTAPTVAELVGKMNALVGEDLVDADAVADLIRLRDHQVRTGLGKDPQLVATAGARRYFGDRRMRVSPAHEWLPDESGAKNGPLIAVRLSVITRKTLGGLETDLSARVLGANGEVVPGLYAVGEAAGFGGGGMHGYRALEGSFLGGCLFSGRTAGRAAAGAV